MSQLKKTTTSDLVMGVLLFAFGIFLIVESLGMKVYNSFLDAPGFLRGGSVEAAKNTFTKAALTTLFLNPQSKRVVILSFFMVVYIFGLIGRVHFAIATFLYLFVTFFYLKSTTLVKNIIISAISALVIGAVFQYVFKIPLP